MIKNILQGAVFHDSPCVHDADIIAHLGHDSQVMGDHQHGGTILFSQFLHQIKHLRLNRNIQGSGWLICDKQMRIAYQCHSDNYPLLHTTGKLVGILPCPIPWDTYHFKHGFGLFHRLLSIYLLMELNHLRDLVTYGNHRIQRSHRILKYHGYLVASDGLHLFLAVSK